MCFSLRHTLFVCPVFFAWICPLHCTSGEMSELVMYSQFVVVIKATIYCNKKMFILINIKSILIESYVAILYLLRNPRTWLKISSTQLKVSENSFSIPLLGTRPPVEALPDIDVLDQHVTIILFRRCFFPKFMLSIFISKHSTDFTSTMIKYIYEHLQPCQQF